MNRVVLAVVLSVARASRLEFEEWARSHSSDSSDEVPSSGIYEEVRLEDGTVRKFTLGNRIARGYQSCVFELKHHPSLAVKYQADCWTELPYHPLIRDAWFLKYLEETGVAPQVLYVSPGFRIPASITTKTNFKMSMDERDLCRQEGGTVRFMLMERVTRSIYADVAEEGPDFEIGVSVMRSLIQALETIHALNVVHGDIHPGNVALQDVVDEEYMSL